MPEIFTANDIDFDLYMRATEAEQKVRSAGAFVDEVVDYFWSENRNRGDVLPWAKTAEQISFRPGEVTLWTGYSGSGKSLVLGQACLGFAMQGQKVCICSFEMQPVVTLARICRQATGFAKPDKHSIRSFHEKTDPLILLYDQQGAVKPDMVLAVMRYCAAERDVKHIVIDSFMKCGVPEDGPSALNAQKEFMDQLCAIARDTGMHVHVVAHSRKQKDELDPPGKMDVKGSGSLTDQVDNVIAVWRNKIKEREKQEKGITSPHEPDSLLLCDKQRHGEWEGRIGLWFLPGSSLFVEDSITDTIDMMRSPRK